MTAGGLRAGAEQGANRGWRTWGRPFILALACASAGAFAATPATLDACNGGFQRVLHAASSAIDACAGDGGGTGRVVVPVDVPSASLGWSLGALSAFSPSFWAASDRSSVDAIQKTRLVHRIVDACATRPDLRMWFSVGGAEEADDRDGDGIIDAVDDVQDVIMGYRAADGFSTRGLARLGYSVNLDYAHRKTRDDVVFYLLPDGRHDQAAWSRMLPEFLRWAFGTGQLSSM